MFNFKPHSWPSQVLVVQSYSISTSSGKLRVSYKCGGTLIRGNVILTAGHCLNYVFDFSSNGKVTYTPNSDFPTIESTYSIYLGLHDISSLPKGYKVSKIIRVCQYFLLSLQLNKCFTSF